MKASEIREKSDLELNKVLVDLSREKFNLRMQKASGQISKPHRIEAIRRDIARINTILGQRGASR